MVCSEKIGRLDATLSPWLARASNVSSQLPRRSDCRISEITSCALAGPENAARARAPAPERKKRRLVFIVIPGSLFVSLGSSSLGFGPDALTLRWPALTMCQPSLKPAVAQRVPCNAPEAVAVPQAAIRRPVPFSDAHWIMAAAWLLPHTTL